MKILVLSDLHLDHLDEGEPDGIGDPLAEDGAGDGHSDGHGDEDGDGDGVDVVVLAGDIDEGERGLDWIERRLPDVPVVYVAGNHEFYGHEIGRLTDRLRERTAGTGVRFLENDRVEIDGVTFLGCTLWTDFELHGPRRRRDAMPHAARTMNDFRLIRIREPGDDVSIEFGPTDAIDLHRASRAWLEEELARAADEPVPTVVVTHHAPIEESIAEGYRDDLLAVCYASHLDDLIEDRGPDLWIHGHTHVVLDVMVGATRVVSNARGYPSIPEEGFDPRLVIEV